MTSVEGLPADVLVHLCRFFDSSELLQLRATSTKLLSFFTNSVEADMIWRNALAQDFHFVIDDSNEDTDMDGVEVGRCMQTLGIHPDRGLREITTSIFGYGLGEEGSVFTAATAFESWKNWSKARHIFYQGVHQLKKRTIYGPYLLRAAYLWRKIHHWCRSDESGMFGDRLLETLRPGIKQFEGRFAGRRGYTFEGAHACEAIFAFCDGQNDLISDAEYKNCKEVAFFGGLYVYDHQNYTRLTATDDSLKMFLALNNHSTDIPISCNYSPRTLRFICLDVETGELTLQYHGRDGLLSIPAYKCKGERKFDVGLLWMEEYVNRLENRHLQVSETHLIEMDDGAKFGVLSAFPSVHSPLTSRNVTRGIEVVASSVGASELGFVIYSIRIRMLTQGEDGYLTPQERGFDTCQLFSRHWIIHNRAENTSDQVNGEGVVGRYPLLREGGYRDDTQNRAAVISQGEEETGTFQYQSCCDTADGSFKGQIKFVPGSIQDPTGEEFFVDVGEFALQLLQDVTY